MYVIYTWRKWYSYMDKTECSVTSPSTPISKFLDILISKHDTDDSTENSHVTLHSVCTTGYTAAPSLPPLFTLLATGVFTQGF